MKNFFLILLALIYLMVVPVVKSETTEEALNRLFQEGLLAYRNFQYQKAIRLWERGLNLAEKNENKEAIGGFLTNIGVVYNIQGQYNEALIFHKKALIIHRELGNLEREGDSLSNIGNVYIMIGQYNDAHIYFNQALPIHIKTDNLNGVSHDLIGIGQVLAKLKHYDEALSYYNKSLSIRTQIDDKKGMGDVLTVIGKVYFEMGDHDKAISISENAQNLYKESLNPRGEMHNFLLIGAVYEVRGEYNEALIHYKKALSISKELKTHSEEVSLLINIGWVYLYCGQYDKAIDYFNESLTISKNNNYREQEGNNLKNIGVVYRNKGKYKEALSYLEKSLLIHREIHNQEGEGATLGNIGVVYDNMGQYENALIYYNDSLAIRRKIKDKRGECYNLINIGVLYENIGQYEKSEKNFEDSLKICNEAGFQNSIWQISRGLGSVQAKLGKLNPAVSNFEYSLNIIESIREIMVDKEFKKSFMQGKFHVYDEYITLLQALHEKSPSKGHDSKAIEIFERKQGRIFLEEMGKSGARNLAGIPDYVLSKEEELNNRIIALQNTRTEEGSKHETDRDTNKIRKLEQETENLKKEEILFQQSLKTDYPDYYALKYPIPSSLKEIQETVLKDGEMMLVYNAMKENTVLWVIGKSQFVMLPIQTNEKDLAAKVLKFIQDMTKDILQKIKEKGSPRLAVEDSLEQLIQSGHFLYNLLIPERVRPLIAKSETLYIVPTSSLYFLPFDALVTRTDKDTPCYLAEDIPISYLSSASLLKIIRDSQSRKKESPKYPYLAFAHPVYKSDFKELPETETEAREIFNILKAPEKSNPLHLREKAARSSVLKMHKNGILDDYRYVLFSCHGILPDKINYLTQPALVLSQPDPVTKEDGYLTMADVFGMKLNADLVVLSACNTGLGEYQHGEGIMGLTRAFLYAGTPAVAVTLWSVESMSSKTFTTGFFQNLKSGKKRAEALQDIKLKMIHGDNELNKHPFFWAPLVLFGEGK